MYNQGVILWNAGKIGEAKKQFEAAVQANPNHAEAHYQLGMALVNEGNLAGAATEFETYLKLVAGRAERGHRQVARRAAEEVASNRARLRRAPRPAGRRPRVASRAPPAGSGATPPPSGSSPSPRHSPPNTSGPRPRRADRLRRKQGPGSAAEDGRRARSRRDAGTSSATSNRTRRERPPSGSTSSTRSIPPTSRCGSTRRPAKPAGR